MGLQCRPIKQCFSPTDIFLLEQEEFTFRFRELPGPFREPAGTRAGSAPGTCRERAGVAVRCHSGSRVGNQRQNKVRKQSRPLCLPVAFGDRARNTPGDAIFEDTEKVPCRGPFPRASRERAGTRNCVPGCMSMPPMPGAVPEAVPGAFRGRSGDRAGNPHF